MRLSENAKIILYDKPVRMYKGFDSLFSIVITELNIVFDPEIFILFVNAERNRFKMLYFERGNIAILAMRLPGVMQVRFGEIQVMNSESFYKLVTTIKSRQIKARYGLSRVGFYGYFFVGFFASYMI